MTPQIHSAPNTCAGEPAPQVTEPEQIALDCSRCLYAAAAHVAGACPSSDAEAIAVWGRS